MHFARLPSADTEHQPSCLHTGHGFAFPTEIQLPLRFAILIFRVINAGRGKANTNSVCFGASLRSYTLDTDDRQ